jgi:molecular chaperone GrpE (heat shock protein)
MAISQEDSKVLAAVFGEEVAEKISGAVTEDLTLGLRLNGKILSPEQIRAERESGIIQGKELGYKDIAKESGITLDAGEKDPKIIAEKLKNGLSAFFEEKYKNQTPTEETIALAKKASEYEEKNKKLLETVQTKEREAGEWQEKYTRKERETFEEKLNNRVIAAFGKDMKFDRGDALLITRSKIEFSPDESGNIICKREGKIITNAMGDPETPENVVLSFSEEKGWYKQGGMGGSDRKNEAGSKYPSGLDDEGKRQWLKGKGIAPLSPEGLKIMSEWRKQEK